MPLTYSWDIGGVITANVDQFIATSDLLRKQGHRVIIVSAIGHGSIIPAGEAARHGFSIGRLYQLGVNLGVHYDACFTTPDPPDDSITGQHKDDILRRERAVVHVDDNPKVCGAITHCPYVLYAEPVKKLSSKELLELIEHARKK